MHGRWNPVPRAPHEMVGLDRCHRPRSAGGCVVLRRSPVEVLVADKHGHPARTAGGTRLAGTAQVAVEPACRSWGTDPWRPGDSTLLAPVGVHCDRRHDGTGVVQRIRPRTQTCTISAA